MTDNLSVREIQAGDVEFLTRYWTEADPENLKNMGADPLKIPAENDLRKMLLDQLERPYSEKESYCTIWLVNGKPAGHSNVNNIVFGEQANMHLHFWTAEQRNKGYGSRLVPLSLAYFFSNLKLKKIICEPAASNAGPNKTLAKAGFRLVSTGTYIPGSICFEQEVNRWELAAEDFHQQKERTSR